MIPSQVLVSAIGRKMYRIEDLLTFPLPPRWLDLPEETQIGLSWWHLMDLLYARRIAGDMQPMSALKDVDICLLRTAEDALEFVPRTHEPNRALEAAAVGFAEGDLLWVVVEFAYDGPVQD